MANVLIVYYSKSQYPLRTTVADHLYSFQRYSGHHCFYLNLAIRGVPWYLRKIHFDLVLYHTIFLSMRWRREFFLWAMQDYQTLKEIQGVRAILPQDEFINTDLLEQFIKEYRIDHVFSNAPASEWEKIYPGVDPQRVRFSTVLTGYLDEATLARICRLAETVQERTIDIGYRAWQAEAWLGRHGMLKTQVAELFQKRAPEYNLKTDISTRAEDTLLGDHWYEFMLRCKYVIGVESGASILDRDGSIRQATNDYLARHPQASFEQVEAACFPGLDNSLQLWTISPRHLEACATRTCQVLVEGSYSGVLQPGRHYLELKRDFSNLNEVLEQVRSDQQRSRMVQQAYDEVVATGAYTYRGFVDKILFETLGGRAADPRAARLAAGERLFWAYACWSDQLSWLAVMINAWVMKYGWHPLRKVLASVFSEGKIRLVASQIRQMWRKI